MLVLELAAGILRPLRSTLDLKDPPMQLRQPARRSVVLSAAMCVCACSPVQPEVISLLGRPLYPIQDSEKRVKLEADLESAREELAQHPEDPAKIVWVGRRLGYLWRMNEAIAVYTEGIAKHPSYAPLYRHRGHRYISLRRFEDAEADLAKAARLIEGQPDQVELDGMPNELNIPLTTTAFNVWYHLGLTRYLQGDLEDALSAYEETLKFSLEHDDNLVATLDWMYMTLRRLGHDDEAESLLQPIHAQMRIIENHAYHRRLLMYKRELQPEDLLDGENAGTLDWATQGYGVGNWHLCNGQQDKARDFFEGVVAGDYWPAFGFIAAEVELARMRDSACVP